MQSGSGAEAERRQGGGREEARRRQNRRHSGGRRQRGWRWWRQDAWRAEWRGFDLSPSKDGPRPLEGSIRLYNVSHETRYEPGADPS